MITLSMWFAMGGAGTSCLIGGAAVMAAALTAPADPGRGRPPSIPPAVRSQRSRPDYLILQPTGAPWPDATEPEPWPAIPEHLHSAQMAQLAALSREVDVLQVQAEQMYGPA